MDRAEEVIAELAALTRNMADSGDPPVEAFDKQVERRAALIQALCAGAFDPTDERIGSIAREGSVLLDRMHCRRDLLRAEMASLEDARRLMGGVKSTLLRPRHAIDVTA